MRFTQKFFLIFTLCFITSAGLAQQKFEIDRSHSNIGFTVRHMLVAKVSGSFTDFSGTILYDEKDITKSSVNVTIKTASINTQNERRDNHLRSEDFFNAATDSVITFVSKSVKKSKGGYIAVGDLTIRGVTREIELPFNIIGTIKEPRGTRMGIEAAMTLNRFDYGVKWDRKLDNGGLVVSNEVQINVAVEAIARAEQ
ncbi:MAG: YceI family protein [candidate division KSB1 bacterium]|nr:YceI family protein [candidate division KSB1 bacterium]MDZ7366164.1 YceI family protein [candidate division KSB1 bacterium]MDZ7404194.1 YceI family protein [candidate division KSB1 bacterium]